MGFPKISHWNMIFLVVLSGKMTFLLPENMILFFRWKMKDDLYQEIHGNMIFLYICINVTNMILPFCKKSQRWSSPEKIHLNVIDIGYCILERVLKILCTFMETFIGIFIYWFPIQKKKNKKTGNLIYRIEIWLLLLFTWLEISYVDESSILCTIQLSGVVFRGVLEHQLRRWVMNPKW